MLHIHLNVPITGRTNGWSLGTFKRQCRFENHVALYRSILSILLCFFQERNCVPDVYSSLHDAVLIFCWILPIAGGISDKRRFGSWRFSRYSDDLSVLRLMALVGTSWMLVCNAYRCHQCGLLLSDIKIILASIPSIASYQRIVRRPSFFSTLNSFLSLTRVHLLMILRMRIALSPHIFYAFRTRYLNTATVLPFRL